jgi:AcrR family transcriptional regulator
MEGVAARAGVSKALPYTHFDDAQDMLLALRDREVAALTIQVGEALAHSNDDAERQVQAVVHAAFETAIQRGGILTTLVFALPFSNETRPLVDEEPSQIAVFFVNKLGLSPPVARVAASIVIVGLTGALLSLDAGLVDRDTAEAVFARMVHAGVTAVRDDEIAGRLPG